MADSQFEFISYDDACTLVDTMTQRVMNEVPPGLLTSALEQVRAVARDHLLEIGCDSTSELEMRGALCGCLMAISLQAQGTPVVMSCVLLARALVDMGRSPLDEDDEFAWDDLFERLQPPPDPPPTINTLLRQLFTAVKKLLW